MSKEKYKLHGITAVIEALKTFKELFLPFIIVIIADGFKSSKVGVWYIDYLQFLVLGTFGLLLLITGIVKWKRYEYWFEDNELRIEYGVFVRKKRYIPFDRIQSLAYTEGLFHRPLKLVKVKVETAGGSAKEAEAELTAITKEAAQRIEEELLFAKRVKSEQELAEFSEQEDYKISSQKIFTMPTKDLFVLATTSSSVWFLLSGMILFIFQFSDLIPIDTVFEEVSLFIKSGMLLVTTVVLIGLLIVWCISVVITYLAYYQFTVVVEETDLIITRGIIEKKRATIPLNRVQSVRVIENPLRKLFGYAVVIIGTAGGGLGEGASIPFFPLVKKSNMIEPLQKVFPDLQFDEPKIKAPIRSKKYFYRIDFLWMIPVMCCVSYFYYPYGMISFFLIPIIMAWRIWQYYATSFYIKEQQLTLRFRKVSLQTAYLLKRRIQAVEMKQSYFQRRNQVATISSFLKEGAHVYEAKVKHLEEQDAKKILAWFEPLKKS